jgi:hypothetical protein
MKQGGPNAMNKQLMMATTSNMMKAIHHNNNNGMSGQGHKNASQPPFIQNDLDSRQGPKLMS